MSYEGVKFKTVFIGNKIPDNKRIDDLRSWCKVFHEKDLAPHYPGGTHGNMSFRLDPSSQTFVVTSARSSFAKDLSDDSFFTVLAVDFETMTINVSGAGNREPSSEVMLHAAIYNNRPDVQAILHGHCKSITKNAVQMNIPSTTEFVESGTMTIVESVLEILSGHNFIEIKDHGFMAFGNTIDEAGELSMKMLEKSMNL